MFDLERADPDGGPPFAGEPLGAEIGEIGRSTGCVDASTFPKYIERGHFGK